MSEAQRDAATVDPVTRQAAAWFARLRADDVSSADRQAFETWLRADLEHRAAYESFERFWSGTGRYAGEAQIARVIKESARRPGRLTWAVAASLAILAVAAAWLSPRLRDSAGVHQTEVGELHTIALQDDSRVTLNTDTRIRVDYADSHRRVWLERGQAYFKVAKDETRPFEVRTRNGVIHALGTEFDVYEQGETVLVTLVEGKVSIRQAGAADAPTPSRNDRILLPGEQATLSPGKPATVEPVPAEGGIVWLEGKLVFDDEPLAYAVAQANRYSTRRIVLATAPLGNLRISGVFRAGETEEFAHAISSYFPVRAQREENGDYLLSAKSEAVR